MKKHAYLVIAHNEFDSLQRLISALDCENNDIYIHIDKKVKELPYLTAQYSKLEIIKNRQKVYWGHFSMVEAETMMLQIALNSGIDYEYLHFVSGVHYPLKPLDEIRTFFEMIKGKCLVVPMENDNAAIEKRLGRYHLFLKNYYHSNSVIRRVMIFLWRLSLYFQYIIGIKRDTSYYGGKVSQWCSLTKRAAQEWVKDQLKIRKRFWLTLCADEFVPMSVIKEHDLPYIECDKFLFLKFEYGNPRVLMDSDYEDLKESGTYWGRKFTEKSRSLIELIENEKN